MVKAAPVARRWEAIEWIEPEVQAEGAAVDGGQTTYEANQEVVADTVENVSANDIEVAEAEPVPESETESVAESPSQDAPKAEVGSDTEPATEA